MENFRERRVYEIRLIAIRDMSPLFCAGQRGSNFQRVFDSPPFSDKSARQAWGRGKGFRLVAFPTNKERRQLWNSNVNRQ